MKKIIAFLLIFALSFASDIKFPQLTDRVVDEAEILSPQTKTYLTQILETHEVNTTNQVVVVTVNSLEGLDMAEYSLELGRHWGIGQKGKDNGVLLVVAPNEREVRIEVGYGLEGELTDAIASAIISQIILPKFKLGDFDGGVTLGVEKILDFLDDNSTNDYVTNSAKDSDLVVQSFILLAFFGIFLGSVAKVNFIRHFGLALFISVFICLILSPFLPIDMQIFLPILAIFIFGCVFILLRKYNQNSGENDFFNTSSRKFGSSGSSFKSSRSGGFSGGGGSFGGGGASGRW